MEESETKIIAFYLPQYHPIAENNTWWGPGFTEWTNVAKARPNFIGHYQPHIPRDLGFYDLRRPETLQEQSTIAKAHGVYGFCFYWYWFNGKQLLETPLYNLLKDKSIDQPFCFCWANENWTRTWDGLDKEILMKQDYLAEQLEGDFIDKLLPFFRDERYIKVNGKPVLLIYRTDIIPDLAAIVAKWRTKVKAHGFPDVHLVCTYSFNIKNYAEYDFDAGVEFPPHRFFSRGDYINSRQKFTNPDFKGLVFDYRGAILQSLENGRDLVGKVYRSAFPSWDNTARRQNNSHIMHNSNPQRFQFWLTKLLQSVKGQQNSEFVFINAWNEWGEGCHLEPDQKYQLAYLEAVKAAKYQPADEAIFQDLNEYKLSQARQQSREIFKDRVKRVPFLYRLASRLYKLRNLIR